MRRSFLIVVWIACNSVPALRAADQAAPEPQRSEIFGPSTQGLIPWRSGLVALERMAAGEMSETLRQAGSSGSRHVVLQFERPLTEGEKATVDTQGVRLLAYVGDNAFFAAVDPSVLDADGFGANTAAWSVQAIRREWKLHSALLNADPPPWSVIKETHDGQRTEKEVAVYVLFHRDVPLAPDAVNAALRHRATVRGLLETVNGAVIELPLDEIPALADEDAVQWIEPPLPLLQPVNDSNRALVGVNPIHAPPYELDGTGVTVLVYDAGRANANHQDFGGRLTAYDTSGLIDHATHVSGTVGGSGQASGGLRKGMAPGVTIASYGLEQEGGLSQGFLYTDPCDLEEDYDEAINSHDADISNNSIGTNTATNGYPCSWEGDYGVTDTVIDAITRGSLGAPFRIVWANGNERQTSICNFPGVPPGYHKTAPPACAKNHLTVGAVNSNDDSMTNFSSWGPADDGRMKPDVSAPGCQANGDGGVTSCVGGSNQYSSYCGTSMASPTVCGLSALLLEDFRAQYPGQPDFRNSTLRILFAHTAFERGNTGPDYQFGYGSVRIQPAVDLLRSGYFLEDAVIQGETYNALVIINPGDGPLKVTIAWDDPPGTPNVSPALVNNLDVRVLDSANSVYFPWTLNGNIPAAPAVRTQANAVDNIEQVVIDAPPPGVYRIEVIGTNVPQGPQPFSICATPVLVNCSHQGSVSLNANSYSCAASAQISVIDCGLNTSDEVVNAVNVTAASTTEISGETVLLTETGPATAAFSGNVSLSATDGSGILHVTPGDTVTVTYVDADNGAGGIDVPVTDSAGVDCDAPIITAVQVTGVGGHAATVSFTTNEPATGSGRYGLSCASLNDVATVPGLVTQHSIQLTGLADATTYFLAVEATDASGNTAIDNNGGACYVFSTPEVQDFFAEQFNTDFDLDNRSFTFVPDGSVDFYDACRETISALPTDPTGGSPLTMTDNTSVLVPLTGGNTALVFGVSYTAIRVGSNGYVTFLANDSDSTETLAEHFAVPRISGLFDDLNPAAGGQVSVRQLDDHVAVTWQNVPEADTSNSNTFQIELFFNGQIRLSYLAIAAVDGICGLSGGGGVPAGFQEYDLSSIGPCEPTPPTALGMSAAIAFDVTTPITLLAEDDGLPDPPGAMTFSITDLPSHGQLIDLVSGPILAVPHVISDGGNQVAYNPAWFYHGTDSFDFRVSDGGSPPQGGDSNGATVSLVVMPPVNTVFFDDFPTTMFSAAKWPSVLNASIDSVGLNPLSSPFSVRLNGAPSGIDKLRSIPINLAGQPQVILSYGWQRTGGGDSPETGNDLFVEYLAANGSWNVLSQHPGSGPDMSTFQIHSMTLPPGALHAQFQMNFGNIGGIESSDHDDWFIDNVSVAMVLPAPLAGDLDCDGALGIADIPLMALALTDPAAYQAAQPNCNIQRADANGDDAADGLDVQPFVDLLLAP